MDRDTVGYRLQRYGEVCSEITDKSTRYEIFKGRVDAEHRVNVPERWPHAQQCLGVAARESTITAR